MRKLHLFALLAGFFIVAPRVAAASQIVGYYDITAGEKLASIPWQYITQLNVSFAGIDSSGTCNWVHSVYESKPNTTYTSAEVTAVQGLIKDLKAARAAKNPKARIVLSVGGAGLSYGFSKAVSTYAGAWHVAWSCADMVTSLGLDGLDYDWEYPSRYGNSAANCPSQPCASSADSSNFTALIQHTRYYLNSNYVLSVAVNHQLQNSAIGYDYAGIDPYINYWNIMTYEMAGSWSGSAQLQAPIDLAQQALQTWKGYKGVTASKLILGVPYYSKFWSNVTNDKGVGTTGGSSNDQGVGFNIVGPRCAGQVSGWSCYVGGAIQGAYCYCRSPNNIWYTYDGPTQMTTKATYVKNNGFGGVMFWSLPNGDDAGFNLTRALYNVLQ